MRKVIKKGESSKEGIIDAILQYIHMDSLPKQAIISQKESKLEELVTKETRMGKKVIIEDKIEFMQRIIQEIHENPPDKSISFKFKKEIKMEKRYSMTILYQENEDAQSLTVDDGTKRYNVKIRKEKSTEKKYQVRLLYHVTDEEERFSFEYNLRNYPLEREEALQDFTNRVDKSLHILPKSMMGGILGFTYLGENFMARRDDLVGDKARMVDVHEAIHTPDEYETRCLTHWMLSRDKPKYIR